METQRKTTMGDVLGNAGTPLFLAHGGKQHPVAYPDLLVLDRVEKLVAKRATASIAELEDTLPPAEFAAQRADLNGMLRAGEHTTGGQLWSREFGADGGTRGLLLMLWACLQEGRSKLEPLELAKLPEVAFEDMPTVLAESPDAAAVCAQVLPDFTRALANRRRIPPGPLLKRLEGLLAQLAPTPAVEPEPESPA